MPAPPSQGVEDFQLLVLNPAGTVVISEFSANKYAGLGTEVAAALEPSGAGKTLTFTGRPELVKATGNNVVVWRVNDGSGWQDVFYGAVTTGWAARPSREPRQYVADASYLLNARVIDAAYYGPQDPALIAADLIRRLRHPALNFTELDFPATGTTLEGGFEQPGITLGEALELLAQSVEDSGRRIDFGVDGRGYVFFRGGGGIAELTYREEDYRDLAVQAADTVTAVYWVIGNEPSEPKLELKGLVEWGTETHLSVPDGGLHNEHGRVIALTAGSPESLYYPIRGAFQPLSGFSNSVGGVYSKLATTANDTATIGIEADAGIVNGRADNRGVRFEYQRDVGLEQATLLAQFQFRSSISDVGAVFGDGYASYELPFTTVWNAIKILIPTIKPFTYTFSNNLGTVFFDELTFVSWSIQSDSAATGLRLRNPSYYKLNTTLLDNAARRELRTPAREPATVTPRRDTPDGPRTYYVKPEPRVRLAGYPGNPLSPTAEWRIGYDPGQGVSTVIDLGNVAREDDEAALIEQLRLGIDTRTRQSEVRTTVGRL